MLDAVIIGLGYVGLPLAHEASRRGVTVHGLDMNEGVVNALNDGRSHVDDLSDADIAELVSQGFKATTDPAVIADAKVVVICVPTPLSADGGPDLGAVRASVKSVADNMSPGTIVILESTTYPGTTDEVVRPILEAGGRVAGTDFLLAFSPERIDPGNATYGVANTPKVVGGHTPSCTDAAAEFYSRFVDTVVRASGTREAEMAKLLENTYRHVNIALVNEMAKFCNEFGIDLWNVIACAGTKPFGFQAFYPGPGVGGHCIPIDPNYLSYKVRTDLGYPFRFVELAQEINESMPKYVSRRVQDLLNQDQKALSGSTVLLLGVTYKANIADERESPARPLAQALIDQGANVVFHDPHVKSWIVGGTEVPYADDLDLTLKSADAVVLVQNHSAYDLDHIASLSVRLLDTRGVVDGPAVERL